MVDGRITHASVTCVKPEDASANQIELRHNAGKEVNGRDLFKLMLN